MAAFSLAITSKNMFVIIILYDFTEVQING